MLKKVMIGLLTLIGLVLIVGAILYFKLNNDIENILETDEDWRSEVLEFPLIFASDLDFEGEEHVRFAPDWGKVGQDDYFSYVFVWLLEKDPKLNVVSLEQSMNVYFDGLMNTASIINFRFFKEIPKTTSSFKQIGRNHYEGIIEFYDEFFLNDIVTLNAEVIQEYCAGQKKYLTWFYLSPKEKKHNIWLELKNVTAVLECNSSM